MATLYLVTGVSRAGNHAVINWICEQDGKIYDTTFDPYREHIELLRTGEKHGWAPVSYNAWVTDKAYRRRLADRLGLEFTDAGRDKIISIGGGSSFTGTRYGGNASAMPVLDRYRRYNNNQEYQEILNKHKDLVSFSDRIFNMTQEKAYHFLVARRAFGLGDWVMAMSAIKMLNIQYPDIQVDLQLDQIADNRFLQDLVMASDARVTPVWQQHNLVNYDWRVDHLVYPDPRKTDSHLIEGMVDTLNNATGLNIQYDPDMLARFRVTAEETPGNDYAIMSSKGSTSWAPNRLKEWSTTNFGTLAAVLANHITIGQIMGKRDDPELAAAHWCREEAPFQELVNILKYAKFVVCLENGISHLAGHLGTKAYTLYMPEARAKPCHVTYPLQTPVTDNPDPKEVGRRILLDIEKEKADSEPDKKEMVTVI